MKNILIDILKMDRVKSRLFIVEERTRKLKDLKNHLNAADSEKDMEIAKESLRDMKSRMRKTKLMSEFLKETIVRIIQT